MLIRFYAFKKKECNHLLSLENYLVGVNYEEMVK